MHRCWDWPTESKLVEKVLVHNKVTLKVTLSQQCALMAKKATTVLGCIKNRTVSRLRDMILPLYLALVRSHLQCCVKFWSAQSKTGTDTLQRAQQEAVKGFKGLRYQRCEERLRKLGLFQAGSCQCVQTPTGREERRQSQTPLSHALWQERKQWALKEIREIPFKCKN